MSYGQTLNGLSEASIAKCFNSRWLKLSENVPMINHSNTETLVLGGGCFWCTEAVYVRVKGVLDVESGYCNGKTSVTTAESNTPSASISVISFFATSAWAAEVK